MIPGSVVWSEGMFIAPQHFQHFEATLSRYVNDVAELDLSDGDYGLSLLETNPDAPAMGKFAIRAAAGVLPDRLFFRLSRELVMDVPDGVVDETVHLAVPLAILGAAQFGDADQMTRMTTSRIALLDRHDPTNEAVETELADVGARLLLGSVDLSGFAAIPVARILEKTSEGRVVLDWSFIPHVLRIGASDQLTDRFEEVLSLARARAANAGGRITAETGASSEASLTTERIELQIINRWLILLQNEGHGGRISPRRFFTALASLTAELDSIHGQPADPTLVYEPMQMAQCFETVLSGLRRRLTLEKPASVVALRWNNELFENRRLLRLVIPPRLLAEDRRPVLALSGPDGALALAQKAPLACKLAGLSAMPDLVSRGLEGVELNALPTAPSELRSRADAAFFSVNTSSSHWQRYLEKREALALHVDDRIEAVEATLYLLN